MEVHTVTSYAFHVSTGYEIERVLPPKTFANVSQQLITGSTDSVRELDVRVLLLFPPSLLIHLLIIQS